MHIKVGCPYCGKSLKAPSQLMGKRVVCPKCSAGFRLASASDSGEHVRAVEESGESNGLVREAAGIAESVTAAGGEGAATLRAAAEVAEPPALPSRVEPRRNTPSSDRSPPSHPRSKRRPQRAKFIATEATETRVQLGADGQLPNLILRDDQKRPPEKQSATSSNPLLLIGVVCFSITMSLILLVMDTNPVARESQSKAEAREKLEQYYIGQGESPAPYQNTLREALRCYHAEDYEAERARYHEVLDMLRASNLGAPGLTGVRSHTTPPNDRHLEDLLATLLSDD